MKLIRIFHMLSFARWLFFIWGVALMVQAFASPARHALANTGLAVFLMGLFLGFLGFGDIEKHSKREKREFAKPRSIQVNSILLLAMAGFTFLMGVYFMNIDALRPGMRESVVLELRMVGYHCLALGFGFLCYLKFILDKYKHFLSLPRKEPGDGADG